METLEHRVEILENKLLEVEERLTSQTASSGPNRRGWRWFLGIDAQNSHFEEAVRLGQEWRNADRPPSDEAPE